MEIDRTSSKHTTTKKEKKRMVKEGFFFFFFLLKGGGGGPHLVRSGLVEIRKQLLAHLLTALDIPKALGCGARVSADIDGFVGELCQGADERVAVGLQQHAM